MKLSIKQKEDIVSLFLTGKYTFTELSNLFSKPISSIKYILNKNNLYAKSQSELQRKYSINEDYFNKIDSPDKAYFLGWIYSDGSINLKYNSLRISLQETDKEVLILLNNFIGSNKPLRRVSLKDKRSMYSDSKNQYLLEITNKNIVRTLATIGLTENKSLNTVFPNIVDELMPYFIRGYFEGDGWGTCTSITKQIGFVGSKSFIESLKDILLMYGMKFNINKKGKVFTLTCGGKNNKNYVKFYDFVYSDLQEMRLNRKFNKVKELASNNILTEGIRLYRTKCKTSVVEAV